MLKSFRHNPTLEAMLSFAGWQGGFSESDKHAMAESLNTILNCSRSALRR